MCYITLVAVVNRLNDLTPEELGLEFRHLPVGLHFQIAVQAASVDILHHEENLLVAFEYLKQLCNVLMVQLLHDLHLSLDRLASIWLHKLCFLVDLDSDLLIEEPMKSKTHYGVCTLTDPLSNEVVVEVFDRAILSTEFVVCRLAILQIFEHLVLGMTFLFLSRLRFILLLRLCSCCCGRCRRLLLSLEHVCVLEVSSTTRSLIELQLVLLMVLLLLLQRDLTGCLAVHGLRHNGWTCLR